MIAIQSCKTAIAMAAVFAGSSSFAATMSKTEYSSTKDHVSADFKADKAEGGLRLVRRQLDRASKTKTR